MQICILVDDLPILAEHMEPDFLKKLSIILTKSNKLGTIILVSGTKNELKEHTKNVAVHTALQSKCVVITDGNPAEYTFLTTQDFPVYANTSLDEDEAALLQDRSFHFILC